MIALLPLDCAVRSADFLRTLALEVNHLRRFVLIVRILIGQRVGAHAIVLTLVRPLTLATAVVRQTYALRLKCVHLWACFTTI